MIRKEPSLDRTDRLRLFFALWPDQHTRLFLSDARARLMVPDTARCVDPANLHMTLVFLGSVDTSTQRCCESAADTVRADRFSIIFNRLGCWARRGIAWAGASPHPAALSVLVEQLNAALDRCGFKPEARPFRAHVTLARNARHCNSGVSIEPFRWDVDRFCLVVSDPNTAGRRYQILRAWNLS